MIEFDIYNLIVLHAVKLSALYHFNLLRTHYK